MGPVTHRSAYFKQSQLEITLLSVEEADGQVSLASALDRCALPSHHDAQSLDIRDLRTFNTLSFFASIGGSEAMPRDVYIHGRCLTLVRGCLRNLKVELPRDRRLLATVLGVARQDFVLDDEGVLSVV